MMTKRQKIDLALAKLRALGALPETIYLSQRPRIVIDRAVDLPNALLCRVGGVERRMATVHGCHVEWVA